MKLCRRCNKSIIATQDEYDLFEGMHWLCFHMEFEHDTAPGEPCSDPSCPWLHLEIFKNKFQALGINLDLEESLSLDDPLTAVHLYKSKLKSFGEDPDEILGQAIDKLYEHTGI